MSGQPGHCKSGQRLIVRVMHPSDIGVPSPALAPVDGADGGGWDYSDWGPPTGVNYDAKRLIGRRYINPSVQSDIKLWPFKVIVGPGDKPMIVVSHKGEEKQFSAEEISPMDC